MLAQGERAAMKVFLQRVKAERREIKRPLAANFPREDRADFRQKQMKQEMAPKTTKAT